MIHTCLNSVKGNLLNENTLRSFPLYPGKGEEGGVEIGLNLNSDKNLMTRNYFFFYINMGW